ncbi:hypothetical protein MSG28_010059, partial [Choristoneura fumiferana]
MAQDVCSYDVARNDKYGRYLTANKDIESGELIFTDKPFAYGPKPDSPPLCLGCYCPVAESLCARCGWPACGAECAAAPAHAAECAVFARARVNVVTFLLEHCRLGDRFDKELVQQVCGILEVNAVEIPSRGGFSIRAVYPRLAIAAHSCVPNIVHTILQDDYQVQVRAATSIKAGQPLHLCYTHVLSPTLTRRDFLLESKFFWCDCPRCADPTELGSHLSTLKCSNEAAWQCTDKNCGFKTSSAAMRKLLAVVQAELYGRVAGYGIDELPDLLLERKAELARLVLAALDAFSAGLITQEKLKERLQEPIACLAEASKILSREDPQSPEGITGQIAQQAAWLVRVVVMESAACRRRASDAEQSARWTYSVTAECEPVAVKEEPEGGECGVSEAAVAEGLYAGHEVKDEVVIGPVTVQQQDVAFSMQNAFCRLEGPCSLKPEGGADDTPDCTHTCLGEGPRCNRSPEQQYRLTSCFVRLERLPVGDLHRGKPCSSMQAIPSASALRRSREQGQRHTLNRTEVDPCQLQPAGGAGAAPECTHTRPGEGPRCNMSHDQQFQLRSCSVRLERILIEDLPTCDTCSEYPTYKNIRTVKDIDYAYAPTESSTQEEIDKFYNDLEKAHNMISTQYIIAMGDFNAQIGKPKSYENKVAGIYGFGKRSKRGERLMQLGITKGAKCREVIKKTPVFFMPPLLSSADTALEAGVDAGLPYLISDDCFDTWVGNPRGTYYGRRHIRLDPDKDKEFWEFSVDEIGTYDIPAMIDYVSNKTGEDKITKGAKCKEVIKKTPVFFMPPLLSSADTALEAGVDAGLPYLISDDCFDTWVGNARGTYYGRRHIRLDPDKDKEFWEFSVDEIGTYDIPAMIDYVSNKTGEDKLGITKGAKCKKVIKKTPVFFMPPLLSSADTALEAGVDAGLPYLISDDCFDTWVGNPRGTYYGRRHIRLDPDRDKEFWEFSVDEIGTYDIPAMVDYVSNKTGED